MDFVKDTGTEHYIENIDNVNMKFWRNIFQCFMSDFFSVFKIIVKGDKKWRLQQYNMLVACSQFSLQQQNEWPLPQTFELSYGPRISLLSQISFYQEE